MLIHVYTAARPNSQLAGSGIARAPGRAQVPQIARHHTETSLFTRRRLGLAPFIGLDAFALICCHRIRFYSYWHDKQTRRFAELAIERNWRWTRLISERPPRRGLQRQPRSQPAHSGDVHVVFLDASHNSDDSNGRNREREGEGEGARRFDCTS